MRGRRPWHPQSRESVRHLAQQFSTPSTRMSDFKFHAVILRVRIRVQTAPATVVPGFWQQVETARSTRAGVQERMGGGSSIYRITWQGTPRFDVATASKGRSRTHQRKSIPPKIHKRKSIPAPKTHQRKSIPEPPNRCFRRVWRSVKDW